jgi:hypothetical protein
LITETRKGSALPFARFERLAHRFFDWKTSARRDDLEIGVFVGPSFDYDIETLKGVARLRARRGGKFQILNLGGLRIRRGGELTAWLEERKSAGIIGFHTSLASCGDTHDRWNGRRRGDFDYQTMILRLGGERGMVRHERLFLTPKCAAAFQSFTGHSRWHSGGGSQSLRDAVLLRRPWPCRAAIGRAGCGGAI